jgi:hypothetical protein
LRRLDHWYGRGLEYGPASLDAPVRIRSEHLGRDVRVATTTGVVEGRLETIEVGRGITLAIVDGRRMAIGNQDVRAIE